MDKSKVLGSAIALIYVLFAVYLFNGQPLVAYNISVLICPFIALIYFLFVKKKTLAFSLFLLFYSLSEILALFSNYLPNSIDYFVGNTLYILAYSSLLFGVCKRVCVLSVLKSHILHVIVLLVLNIYIIYVLQIMVETPIAIYSKEFFIELTYNVIILVLLSIALLNYFYKDNKKSLYMFIGTLCIVFAEVIGIAYLYLGNETILNFISVTLYLMAFIFLFKQSQLKDDNVVNPFIGDEV